MTGDKLIVNEGGVNQSKAKLSGDASLKETAPKMTRRNFLGAMTLGAFLGPKNLTLLDEIDRKFNQPVETEDKQVEGEFLRKLDIVNHPDYWTGDKGKELTSTLEEIIYSEFVDLNANFRAFVDMRYDIETGPFQESAVKESLHRLMEELTSRAGDISIVETENLANIRDDVRANYYEVATFAQMLVDLLVYKEEVGFSKFLTANFENIFEKNLDSMGSISLLEEKIKRPEIGAVWNYDWPSIDGRETKISPMVEAFLSSDGSMINSVIDKFVIDLRLAGKFKSPIQRGKDDDTGRPNKAEIVNFDPEVADLIIEQFQRFGLDRAMTQLILEASGSLVVSSPNEPADFPDTMSGAAAGDGNTYLFHSNPQALNLKQYQEREQEILQILLHEGFHSLSMRRKHLPRTEELKLRNIEKGIFHKFNPLTQEEKVFYREGEDHGYIADNECSLVKYYLTYVFTTNGFIEAERDDYDLMAKMFKEFNKIISSFTDNDIDSIFGEDDMEYIEDFFARIKNSFNGYEGLNKLLVKIFLDNEEVIKNETFLNSQLEGNLMPLLFAHLIMYRTDEVIESILYSGNLKVKSELVTNYVTTLKKRINSWITDTPCEEYLAVLFSTSLLTDKYGPHEVDYVNQLRPEFGEILKLFRDNNLALTPNDSTAMI